MAALVEGLLHVLETPGYEVNKSLYRNNNNSESNNNTNDGNGNTCEIMQLCTGLDSFHVFLLLTVNLWVETIPAPLLRKRCKLREIC